MSEKYTWFSDIHTPGDLTSELPTERGQRCYGEMQVPIVRCRRRRRSDSSSTFSISGSVLLARSVLGVLLPARDQLISSTVPRRPRL